MNDDELMMLVREVLAADEEPSTRVLAAARAAFRWLCVEDVLADLIFDSADQPAATGMGSRSSARQLAYSCGDLLIECELDGGVLLGQVIPAGPVRIDLRCGNGGQQQVPVDDQGRFAVEPAPAGPLSIRCRRAGRPAIVTPWVLA